MRKLIFAVVITLATLSVAIADTIYLRGGTSLRGTVLGFINGRIVVRLTTGGTLSLPSGNRNQPTSTQTTRQVSAGDVIFLRPRDIERIEIDGRSLDDARYQSRTLDVSLGPNWIDSGIDVQQGERMRIDATGTIYAGRTRITPAGLTTTDPSAPLPRAAEGELIGVIGNDFDSPIIEIGASREFVADRDGRLYLTVNRGSYLDARGAFNVRVRKEVDLVAMTRGTGDRNRNIDDEDSLDPFGLPDTGGTSTAPSRPRRRGDSGPTGRNTLERVVDVPGNASRGVDTGIDVRAGDQITISATGNITAGQRAGVVSPEGGRQGAGTIFGVSRRPVPTAGVGALIGYIVQTGSQSTQPFLVGSQLTFTASSDGRLYLMVNDDNFSDNSGSFQARILYPNLR